MDMVNEAALANDQDLVTKQREAILDPFDPNVIEAAKKEGLDDNWIDAAQRSPIYKIVKKWKIALPLHPEFRTLPSLFYIPPLAPITTSAGKDSPSDTDVFDMTKPEKGPLVGLDELDKFRLPITYLASMFGAGNKQVVKTALLRQLAVRHYERSLRVEKEPNLDVLKQVGLTAEDAKAMVRGLSLAFYNERFVVPTTKRENAEISPYTERGLAGFDKMNPWSPMKRRKSYFKSHHTGSKDYE
jgi:nitrate reductase beta subunit